MPWILGEPTVQQYVDANGDPLVNGSIEFFETGTSTPAAVASDSAGSSTATSYTLNSIGAPQTSGGTAIALFFDSAVTYKIVRKDASGTPVAPTIDPYNVTQGAQFAIDAVDSGASDSLYDYVGSEDGQQALVAGYFTPGDSALKPYYWNDTNADTDDKGITILPTGHVGAGRWKLIFEYGISVRSFGAKGDGSTDDTTAIQAAIDYAATVGGKVKVPNGDYQVSLQASTVALDTFTSIGCAILLPSWVDIEGEGLGASSSTPTGAKITLKNSQNCHVLANFTAAPGGVSGCQLRNLNINGNRANNLTAGSGIFLPSVFSNTTLTDVKIGQTREHGIMVFASSGPIWFTNVFAGATGKNGVFIDGATTNNVNLLNLQVDNAGINGTGEAGLHIDSGSIQDSNFNIFNYKFECLRSSDPNASTLGIKLNNLNGSQVLIAGSSGKSDVAATNFIEIAGSATGNEPRMCFSGITTSSNFTNIYNDTINTKTIAYSTSGLSFFANFDIRDILKIRGKTTNGICALSTSAGTGRLTVNKLSDGGTGGNVDFFQGTDVIKANIDGNGTYWAGSGLLELGGSDETTPDAIILTGNGSPEGVVTANVGSIYMRLNGGAGTSMYVKESGTGNTGWVAK